MKKKGIIISSILAAVSATGGAVIYKIRKDAMTFSTEKWNQNVANRYKIVDDLIRNYNIVDMSRDEIIKLLGINGLRSNSADSMEYYIGIDKDKQKILILDFDENDKVIKGTACM